MKTGQLLIILLALTLAACAPARLTPSVSATDAQNTSIEVIGTAVALTQAAAPTVTPLPPTLSPTKEATLVLETPIPTLAPPPIFTPDTIQLERWQEYQTELAKALFVYNPSFPYWGYGPDAYTDALCEWDILRQRNQEVYVWATCVPAAHSPLNRNSRIMRQNPAVIYLKPGGSIREVNVGKERTDSQSHLLVYNLRLFPEDLQGTLCSYYFINVLQCYDIAGINLRYRQSRQSVLASHLKYREGHTEEPPLIVLSAMPTATPSP